MRRPLVLAAHGTADPHGRHTLSTIAQAVDQRLPGVQVRLGFVDVCRPRLADVLRDTPEAVVVPLFLAAGYHVHIDIPAAVNAASTALGTEHLGSGPLIVQALAARLLEEATDTHPSAVLLASAGSSMAAARGEVTAVAAALARRLQVPVEVAFLSGPRAGLAAAYAALQQHTPTTPGRDHKVVVAAHLLAPGHFYALLAQQANQLGLPHSEPIGNHHALINRVHELYVSARPHSK